MTIDIIANKADFQRHLNGSERRLNDLTKSLQIIEKSSQKLLLNNTIEEQEVYFKQLDDIIAQIKFLYSSILTLEQCSFAVNGKKRLEILKKTLEKNQLKFEQIQKYSRTKFGYEYEQESDDQEEQSMKLLQKNSYDENIELDLINQRAIRVNHFEQDINDLHGTFIDMNRIIHEQGTIIDNIELALTSTDEMVYEAKENIQTTVKVKKRSTRLKWIFILSAICFVLLLVIVIYFTLRLAVPLG
jgi:hypothetical protein